MQSLLVHGIWLLGVYVDFLEQQTIVNILPLKVHQYQDEMLHHADGRALRSLCAPGMGGPSQVKMLQAKEPQDILKEILDSECKGYGGQGGKVLCSSIVELF